MPSRCRSRRALTGRGAVRCCRGNMVDRSHETLSRFSKYTFGCSGAFKLARIMGAKHTHATERPHSASHDPGATPARPFHWHAQGFADSFAAALSETHFYHKDGRALTPSERSTTHATDLRKNPDGTYFTTDRQSSSKGDKTIKPHA